MDVRHSEPVEFITGTAQHPANGLVAEMEFQTVHIGQQNPIGCLLEDELEPLPALRQRSILPLGSGHLALLFLNGAPQDFGIRLFFEQGLLRLITFAVGAGQFP